MANKRIEIDGKFYRERRGKLVQIPDEWVGHTLHQQTKRKRVSKQTKHQRNSEHRNPKNSGYFNEKYLRHVRGKSEEI